MRFYFVISFVFKNFARANIYKSVMSNKIKWLNKTN
jgi:hypothetical protein